MKIYIDNDFKCHTTNQDASFREVDSDFFNGKCAAFIEGYRYIPAGESWTREDGTIFRGEMIAPLKDFAELDTAQRAYERQTIADAQGALEIVGVHANEQRTEAARKLRPYIEKAAESLGDADALEAVRLFPAWQDGAAYEVGKRVHHDGKLYRVAQAHTSQAIYPPGDGTEALYTVVNVTHAGTENDPIPYDGNMVLEEGKYYTQSGVLYHCWRGTEIAVYNSLWSLAGLYVTAVDLPPV